MRQLIAWIDEDVHRRLKERAAREGRSLNDLVTDVLAAAADDELASFRRRLVPMVERTALWVARCERMRRSAHSRRALLWSERHSRALAGCFAHA
jgi:plasmid stability protein